MRVAPCVSWRALRIIGGHAWSSSSGSRITTTAIIRLVGGPTVLTAPVKSLIRSSSTTNSWAASGTSKCSGGVLAFRTGVMWKAVRYRGVGLDRGLQRVTGDSLVGFAVVGEGDV